METNGAMTEIQKPQKFLFDLAFDAEGEQEREKPTYSQEQLDQARRESYDAGYAAGQKAQGEERARLLERTIEGIGEKLEGFMKESAEEWARQLAQLQQIALAIARKILPAYVEKHGLEEIEAIVDRVIAEMNREPRLVVRVAEERFDDVKARVDAITQRRAFSGEVVILGDPSFGPSDCRVEWANGGVERDLKSVWQDISRVLKEIPSDDPPQTGPVSQPAENSAEPPTGE